MVRNSVIAATVIILLVWALVVIVPMFVKPKREHFSAQYKCLPGMKSEETHDSLAYSLGYSCT
jgi:hypothetical protein